MQNGYNCRGDESRCECRWDSLEIDGQIVKGCPWKLVTPMTRAVVELYVAYKDGHMYYSGGVIEQPAWYIECMTAMSNAMNSAEKEMIDAQQSQP